jgi:predicted O-linked N-acetylglucosamine transferase (SPINDLY family)
LLKSHESCLILKNGVLGSAECREFVHKSFEAKGVARNRVQLFGPSAHFEFLQTYSQIDIALDTFPYNGGTTTSEAIWQGVPVVAFWGDRWVSRTSASILRAGGLGEFVQESLDGYISFAVELAKSPETGARLTSLRRDMRTHLAKTPACDTRAFAREMEKIYKQIQAGRMTKDV